MIYKEFRTWRIVSKLYVKRILNGFYGVFCFCLIMGITSVFLAVIRQVNAFYRRETKAAIIITSIILLISFGWIGTFVKERRLYVEAQHKADSLSYSLSKLTQQFDSTELIIINGDTINSCK